MVHFSVIFRAGFLRGYPPPVRAMARKRSHDPVSYTHLLVNRSRGNIAVSVVDLDDVPKEKQSALIEAVEKLAGMKRVRLLGV